MSGRGRGDVVTVVYPSGCREITDDLGSDELIRRLKTLAHKFQSLLQAEDESTYAEFIPLAIHLAEEHYLNHESEDVQLLIGCCIADILRIFAPEAPYKDPVQIKTIFMFIIKQLGGLKDPKDPAFKRYFYLLENLAFVKSFSMCFDLEECSEIFCALFGLIFKIVNDEHSAKVKNYMLDVLCPLITDADIVSKELLDIILKNILDPYKSQRKNAYILAKDLIIKTQTTLEPYIQQFFNQALLIGKLEQKLTLGKRVYDLIYELNLICPTILLAVLPQLEFKLKSTEESERMGSVSLLARMFSEPSSELAVRNPQLWRAFLGRYNDVSVAVRIKCVQYTMHFLLNHKELHEDIIEILKVRQHDPEEAVRYEVVMAIVTAAKRNFYVISDSEDLLHFVKERTMDKKFKIRKEAVTGLAFIYNKHITDPLSVSEATKKAATWIKDKILHGYYMPGIEDRLLVERLLNTRLVPYSLPSEDRMKKLLLLFSTIDENASKAFIEIQKHQLNVRKGMAEFLAYHRLPPSEKRSRDLTHRIHAISRCLPEPIKAQEFIKQLSQHILNEETMLNLFEKIVDPNVSCTECITNVNKVLKKLGSPTMTNLYYGTVKQLLERISSLMIDKAAIRHLTLFVKEALENGPILKELELDSNTAGERSLRLLFVLSFVFPSHFCHEEIILDLVQFLNVESDHVVPLVFSILTFIGKYRPIVEFLPNLHNGLVHICKEYISKGNPKEAKQAVKCLYMNITSSQEAIFTEVLDLVKANLNPEKGQSYRTAIVTLGHIAFHLPELYPIQIKNLVSREIVKKLLMKDNTEPRSGTNMWEKEENLPFETICKMEGMKMMARWLLGLKNDTLSAQKTFRMLNAIIENHGDLLEGNAPSPAERAWLRLSAGCAMLKICEQKGVGDEYSLEQFYNLTKLMVDEVPEVREKFLIKLHKGLGRGIPHKCLPLDFMGLYSLAGLEEDKRIRSMAKQFLSADISRRREYIKVNLVTGSVGEKNAALLPKVMPDFAIVFSIPVLAHWVKFEKYDDIDILKEIQKALWFVLEPLIKNENYSFGFYKDLVERIKQHKDSLQPDDDAVNFKLWATCDLALNILVSRTTSYELKEFPTEPKIPQMYFKPPDDSYWVNAQNYLPPSMQLKGAKKSGASYVLNYIPNSIQSKKRQEELTVVVTTGEESSDKSEATVFADTTNGPVSTRAKRKRPQNGKDEGGDERSEEEETSSVPKKMARPTLEEGKNNSEENQTAEGEQQEVKTSTNGRPKRSTRK